MSKGSSTFDCRSARSAKREELKGAYNHTADCPAMHHSNQFYSYGITPKAQPLVSEFGHYVQFVVKPDMTQVAFCRGSLRVLELLTGNFLLGVTNKWVSDLTGESLMYLEGLKVSEETKVELVTFGVPREPWEFVRKAAQVGRRFRTT